MRGLAQDIVRMLVAAANESPIAAAAPPLAMPPDATTVDDGLAAFAARFDAHALALAVDPVRARRLTRAVERERELVWAQAAGDGDAAARVLGSSRHLALFVADDVPDATEADALTCVPLALCWTCVGGRYKCIADTRRQRSRRSCVSEHSGVCGTLNCINGGVAKPWVLLAMPCLRAGQRMFSSSA